MEITYGPEFKYNIYADKSRCPKARAVLVNGKKVCVKVEGRKKPYCKSNGRTYKTLEAAIMAA